MVWVLTRLRSIINFDAPSAKIVFIEIVNSFINKIALEKHMFSISFDGAADE